MQHFHVTRSECNHVRLVVFTEHCQLFTEKLEPVYNMLKTWNRPGDKAKIVLEHI